MLRVLKDRIAVIPVYASEMIGSLYVPESATRFEDKPYWAIVDEKDRIWKETEDYGEALRFKNLKWNRDHVQLALVKRKRRELGEFGDVGSRCNQGVVKYIGPEVTTVKVGDYVLFSGYTGTLMNIEGEGTYIVMEEKWVMSIYEIDKFIEVPGLYFMEKPQASNSPTVARAQFIPATYEQAMNLLTQAVTDANATVQINAEKPKFSDYDEGA